MHQNTSSQFFIFAGLGSPRLAFSRFRYFVRSISIRFGSSFAVILNGAFMVFFVKAFQSNPSKKAIILILVKSSKKRSLGTRESNFSIISFAGLFLKNFGKDNYLVSIYLNTS